MADSTNDLRRAQSRRVLEYGNAKDNPRGSFPWWVFIGPLSLICLWLRLWGVLPFPEGGRSWHRLEGTMLGWAFLTALVSFIAFAIERTRLGERWRLPIWAIAVWAGGIFLNFLTFAGLIFAVAAAHPR